jgi:hypothetical protein
LALTKRETNLRHRYGIGISEYEELLNRQDFKCATCETQHTNKKPLHVDHEHATGKIRGLLCGSCNRALGLFKDSQENLHKAIAYLKQAESTTS